MGDFECVCVQVDCIVYVYVECFEQWCVYLYCVCSRNILDWCVYGSVFVIVYFEGVVQWVVYVDGFDGSEL